MHIQGCDKMLKQVGIIEAEIMPKKNHKLHENQELLLHLHSVVFSSCLIRRAHAYLILSYLESPLLACLIPNENYGKSCHQLSETYPMKRGLRSCLLSSRGVFCA